MAKPWLMSFGKKAAESLRFWFQKWSGLSRRASCLQIMKQPETKSSRHHLWSLKSQKDLDWMRSRDCSLHSKTNTIQREEAVPLKVSQSTCISTPSREQLKLCKVWEYQAINLKVWTWSPIERRSVLTRSLCKPPTRIPMSRTCAKGQTAMLRTMKASQSSKSASFDFLREKLKLRLNSVKKIKIKSKGFN